MIHRRAHLQYALLLLCFAATLIFQTKAMPYYVMGLLHPERLVASPFLVDDGSSEIITVRAPDREAGIRTGDLLLKVGDRPYSGHHDLGLALQSALSGDVLEVTIRSGSVEKIAHIRLISQISSRLDILTLVGLKLVVPLVSIGLSFWVVAIRPRDSMAWLLLGLLVGFTQLSGTNISGWSGWMLYFGNTYRSLLNQTWGIWMLLFPIYFPEPFPASRWRTISAVLKWLMLPPMTASAVLGLIITLYDLENYRAVSGLVKTLQPFESVVQVLAYTAVGLFTLLLAAKYFVATSRDAKRRLRTLYVGTCVALLPVFILSIIRSYGNTPYEQLIPAWTVAFLLMPLFPLTLAYVIVVHRALDVRMVLRQGLQYALAKTGVRVLQVAGSAVVVYAAATLANDTTRNRAQKITAIAIGFIAILMFRRVAERLRAWTDRRFFRDAYNAEQILTDLSEEVRSIVEPRALLQTVSQKISESLHVRQIAVLLNSAGPYRPEFALGYPASLNVDFPYDAETVRKLRTAREPARIYLDDPESWINRDGQITSEERSRLAELETELLLPLNSRDRLLGFISLGHKLSEEPYSGADLRLLKSVAAQTGLALENAQLTTKVAQEMAQREKMNRELEIAREVQERLYPQRLPPVAGLDYWGLCRPALGVGGDYYDFIPLSGGKLGIAIGDVSGKGISAALMMASLQASLRGQAMVAPDDLATIITNVNQLVYEASSSNRYATFFYAQYHPNTRQLVYVNAGHNPPLLLRKKQASRLASEGDAQGFQIERLDTGGLVVGLLPEVPYQQGSITLQPGDTLFAYTDGVSEAMNPTGEEWGEGHMLQAAEACEGMNAQETIRHVLDAADEFSQGAPQHDDMTLVVVQAV